ncbi:phosphoglycerate dehydrogenase [Methanobrevibacter filiformis]|uniref:D-3-phosphoglycerate dehydrogenase n=1 Tax=Methanobrevibacter filiformis TaxID=55758 RepID=A0A166CWY4_9EURY|nr:phosphoglycerate dehydrogenase [Methanobrevibacter filiformis]KZX14953.1 D-3-phosphoglycerate dehydrogenase [Methanobrevibacter filiformis]
MKVLIADSINQKGIDNLKEYSEVVVQTDITPEELKETINQYDAIVIRSRTKMTKEVIESADNLKIIARAGVGIDNVDLNSATQKGIMVVNTAESTTITVAEHTMGLILAIARKIAIADKSVKENKWEKSKFMGTELRNKTLGVVGMGRIGSQVIKRCKAFEMDALAYDPYLPEEAAKELGIELVDLNRLIKEADFISIHVPLTKETKHLIGEEEFKAMKNGTFIINCSRGGVIDEDALYDALKSGEIAGAGLDVYETEPPVGNKLLELDNLVATPHIAASTNEAQRDAAIIAADEIIEVLKGKTPKNVLNLPSVDPETYQILKPYLTLCEKLGSFIGQGVKGKIKDLEIIYCGELAEIQKQDILTRTILQGLLTPILNRAVNTINSQAIAESRKINVTEGRKCDSQGYDSIIKIKVKTDEDTLSVEGTDLHGPQIIKVNNYWVNAKPEGNMFIAKYEDIPGTIGAIGTNLGKYNINIGTMQVGRDKAGGEAIMILTVDHEIPKDVINELKELENVHDANGLTL